jgi:hypothetical protein
MGIGSASSSSKPDCWRGASTAVWVIESLSTTMSLALITMGVIGSFAIANKTLSMKETILSMRAS